MLTWHDVSNRPNHDDKKIELKFPILEFKKTFYFQIFILRPLIDKLGHHREKSTANFAYSGL